MADAQFKAGTVADLLVSLGVSQAEVVRLRLVLEWYARPANWEWTANGERQEPPPANHDRGLRAREALKYEAFIGSKE